jgi:hypothetical protein
MDELEMDTSFIGRLRAAKAIQAARRAAEARAEMQQDNAAPDDPWLPVLAEVQGELNKDGTAYVTSSMLAEILNVKLKERKAGTYRRIAGLMISLHWQPVRVFGLNARGYREQVRGYARDTRREQQQQMPDQEDARVQ